MYDEYMREVSGDEQRGMGIRTEKFRIPASGQYFIRIQSDAPMVYRYALDVRRMREARSASIEVPTAAGKLDQ